jgi:general secretion pathway protein D
MKSQLAVGFALFCLLSGCAEQRIKEHSQADIAAGRYQAAVKSLQLAVQQYPDSVTLRSALVEARSEVVTRVTAEVNTLRAEGHFDEASHLLDQAEADDPGNDRLRSLHAAIEVQRRQNAALTEAQRLAAAGNTQAALRTVRESLRDDPRNEGLQKLERELGTARRDEQLRSSQNVLAERRPITVDFRDAGVRTVLDTISRASGIDFVLDKDVRPDTRVTVYLRNAKVEDALDLIVGTNQLAKKIIDDKTVMIYPNTAEKQREYQEQVLRVFYLANADAKGAAAYLKQMLRVRDPYVDERTNMLTVRESAETMELVERLLAVYDSAEPEVLLEVEVLEVSSSRLTELGIQFPTSISLTPLPPGGAAGLTLGNVKSLTRDNIALGVGAATINLRREVGDFSTLANPKIRVKSKEKAKIMIGDKIPVVTSTAGSTGFVSDSVSYIDVGVKLEVEPTVYTDDDVAIKLNLEVSTLGDSVKTSSGTLAYQIGTRNATTTLRLHDSETQLLAGLISKSDSSNSNRVPGLGDLPILGRLFSSNTDNGQRTELVLAITPRILRNVRQPPASETEMWIGTEAAPKLRPVGGLRIGSHDEGAPVGTGGQKTPVGATGVQAPAATGAIPQNGQPAVQPPSTTAQAAAASAATADVTPSLSWAGPAHVKVGEEFEMTLQVRSNEPLRGLPLQLQFETASVKLLDASEGDFFKQGGAATSFSKSGDGQSGSLSLAVLRSASSGASGKGDAYKFRFKATAPGEVFVNVLNAQGASQAGRTTDATLPPAQRVVIQ